MLKKLILAFAFVATSAAAQEMSNAEYFARAASGNWTRPLHDVSFLVDTRSTGVLDKNRQQIADLVARHAEARLGHKWKDSAVKIAKLESGFTCSATGPVTSVGRARGVLQVMPSTAKALGFDPTRLYDCDYGIRAGIEHMAKCIEHGVQDHQQMAACHVSGWGAWNKPLRQRDEKYRKAYISLSMR